MHNDDPKLHDFNIIAVTVDVHDAEYDLDNAKHHASMI